MDTLPPETISEIFSHFVEGPVTIPRRKEEDGPLVLATVSRTWLEICFSTSSLWASVLIDDGRDCGDGYDWDDDDLLRFLERWLSRARTHPLDITIFPRSSQMSGVYPILSQYLAQLHHFAFPWDDHFPTDMFYGRVPALTTLELLGAPEEGVIKRFSAFSEAPSLREVKLASETLQGILLPWIQLMRLELEGSLYDSLEILKGTPNLEVLNINIVDHTKAITSPQLTLAHLHTLILHFGHQGIVLDHLILPAIETIKINGFENAGPSRLVALGSRSAWSPRSLHLSSIDPEVSNLCFRSLPSLEEVHRGPNDSYHEDNLAPLLKLLTTDADFLPALRVLTIKRYHEEISSSALIEMLASRWHGKREGIAKLKSFHLVYWRKAGIPSPVLDEIKTLVLPLMEEGLDVVVE